MDTDVATLTEKQEALLDEWSRLQRHIAALQADSAALLAQRWSLMQEEIALAPLHRNAIERSIIAEYSATAHISKGTMENAFADARLLAEDFPAASASFHAGRITPAHVREIVREADPVREAIRTGVISADSLALYEAAALEVAEKDTPARTRAHVREVAAAFAGATVVERHERAREERSVTIRSVGDGLALLQAILPEHLAVAIHDRLTKMARHLVRHPEDRDPVLPPLTPEEVGWDPVAETIFGSDTFIADPFNPDGPCIPDPDDRELPADPMFHDDSPCIIHIPADTRTMDQIRADLFTDLLLTTDPSEAHGSGLDNITATIQVTVSATTLADADELPAQLDGTGPLHPDVARRLAGARTGWTRLFLDRQGVVTETDTYTPSEPMRRYLRARDQHCRFPGCRQPVHRCEIDHNHDYALAGRTAIDNLAHLCGAHHALKHPAVVDSARWTARQLPDRTVEWTSPLGRTYPDPPPRRVMFVPSPPDPFAFDDAAAAEAGASAPF